MFPSRTVGAVLCLPLLLGGCSAVENVGSLRQDSGTEETAQGTSTDSSTQPEPVIELLVTNTRDAGEGSLRFALEAASAIEPGMRVAVRFAIPTNDPGYDDETQAWTIEPATLLPSIDREATSIEGPVGEPRIVLLSKNHLDYGLLVTAAKARLSHLVIGGFAAGIAFYGETASEGVVEACRIGVDVTGTSATPNDNGVSMLAGAHDNTVRNCLVSGNAAAGVFIGGTATSANAVVGSIVGADVSGTKRLPNGIGVLVYKSPGNVIGGSQDEQGNLISGNADTGIVLTNKGAENNVIKGNLIGTDITGTRLLYNDKGIVMKSLANRNTVGGTSPSERNVISGNLEIGIYIEAADGNTVVGNYLGPDITGTKTIEEGGLVQGNGIEFNTVAKDNVLGGDDPGSRNLLSGNMVYGVVYYGHCSNNDTVGNFIGTDVTGTAALPNATGICFDCASHHNEVRGNVISGNLSYGMFFVTRGTDFNVLRGNLIGTDVTGKLPLPNDIGMVIGTGSANNTVGGEEVLDRNVISGNARSGIMLTNGLTVGNEVRGNLIGTDITGTAALPNEYGVLFSSYPKGNIVSDNVISGNESAGLILFEHSEANEVWGNFIGTDRTSSLDLGNGAGGLVIDWRAAGNRIGKPGAGNVIAYNAAGGILALQWGGSQNTISANEFYANEGLEIDLFPFGKSANDPGDADEGPNDGMNAPEIGAARFASTQAALNVEGTLDTVAPQGAVIELFGADPDDDGVYLHWRYLGAVKPGADGAWQAHLGPLAMPRFVAATATDELGSTSELSASRSVSQE